MIQGEFEVPAYTVPVLLIFELNVFKLMTDAESAVKKPALEIV